ncbi:MAG TPA: hypothetical protein VF110_16740, partial [Burkholderiales bacterium]
MKPTLMLSAVIAAGLIALPPAVLAHDNDDDRDRGHHGKHDRAADLNDCCTPGDKDYPTHSGNLG